MCNEPLNSDNHSEGIVNIMTGRIAPDAVNVANYVATGKEPMKQFETSWPKVSIKQRGHHDYQPYVYHIALILTSSIESDGRLSQRCTISSASTSATFGIHR